MKARMIAKHGGLVLFGVGLLSALSIGLWPTPTNKWRYEKEQVLQTKKDELRTWKKQELLVIDHEFVGCMKTKPAPVCLQRAKIAKDVLEITAQEKDSNLTVDSVVAESPKLQENERNLAIWMLASFASVAVGLAMFLFIPAKPKTKPEDNKQGVQS